VYLAVRRVEVNILNMRIWTQFLCVAVALMAAAEPLETSEQVLTPLVGLADKMDREEQMMAVEEGLLDDGEMAEMEAVGADMLVEGGGESLVLQMEEAADMEEGELVLENEMSLEEKWKTRSHGCPKGWEQYGKRCFIYVATKRTWAESEKYCISRGANLASVHSVSEHYFVQDVIRWLTHDFPPTWIGGYDATQEGMWLWSDGTSLDDTIWAPGQPNSYRGGQHCLLMNSGDSKRWDDGTCTAKLPSVCAMNI